MAESLSSGMGMGMGPAKTSGRHAGQTWDIGSRDSIISLHVSYGRVGDRTLGQGQGPGRSQIRRQCLRNQPSTFYSAVVSRLRYEQDLV